MANTLPQTVKVGPHSYRVERWPATRMPFIEGEKPNAFHDKDGLLVAILNRLRRSKVQEFTVHEFLHAIWPADDPKEEEHVTELAPKLLQLIQDNHELIDYLRD